MQLHANSFGVEYLHACSSGGMLSIQVGLLLKHSKLGVPGTAERINSVHQSR